MTVAALAPAQPRQSPAVCDVCGASARAPFREQDGYHIVRCLGCGVRYLSPQPDAAAIAALYAETYFQSGDSVSRGYAGYAAEAANWRATFRDRLRWFPTDAPGRRLLDVGAAAGFFVEQARRAGWDAVGVEPSRWAARYASEELRLPVREGTLEGMRYPDASFDVVTLWEVIEHVPSPRAFLVEAARVLAPGGYLLLSTPDAGSLAARLSGRRWLGWRKVPEHLYYFDRRALARLLDAAGFDVVDARYVSLTVTWRFALERLGALLGLPWLARVPRRLGDRTVRVNPYYDLMLVARRRP